MPLEENSCRQLLPASPARGNREEGEAREERGQATDPNIESGGQPLRLLWESGKGKSGGSPEGLK